MLVAYPVSLPLDAVKSLVAIVKSGKIAESKADFGLAVWNVQGYLQSKALSVDFPISFSATASIYNLEDAQVTADLLSKELPAEGAFGSIFTDAALVALTPLIKWALAQVIKSL